MRNLLIHIVFIFSSTLSLANDREDFDPLSGYRIDHYRYPIDRQLDRGQTIENEQHLNQLIVDGALLIDVAPLPRYFWIEDLKAWQLPNQYFSLPGAIWLPNVGRGKLDQSTTRYLKSNLQKHQSNDRAIIVFCFEDCWMSWNATRRIAELGYENVFWYPKGVTGRRTDQLQIIEPELFSSQP